MNPEDLLPHIMELKEKAAQTHEKVCGLVNLHKGLAKDLDLTEARVGDVETGLLLIKQSLGWKAKLHIGLAAGIPSLVYAIYFFLKSAN